MDASEALARVKTELAKTWLAAPERIAALSIKQAEAAHRGEFEIRSVFVSREIEAVEEPLTREPTVPPIQFQPWAVQWPPENERAIGATKIDVRDAYEVVVCAACAQGGETGCGVCRGSGKVADPKTNKPTRCSGCSGKGTLVCARCDGRGRLLRFKRINQRVKCVATKLNLPDRTKTPSGAASGQLQFGERTPSATSDAVAAMATTLRTAAPDLEPLGWLTSLAQRYVAISVADGMKDARAGWRSIQGRWYEGWKLHCVSNGKHLDYFVPDTGANVVGPKLRSPSKIAGVVGAVTVLLLSVGFVINRRMDAAQAELDAQAQRKSK